MSKSRKQNQEFASQLDSFVDAWKKLLGSWEDHSIGSVNYPFEKSFDDLLPEVILWAETTKKEISINAD